MPEAKLNVYKDDMPVPYMVSSVALVIGGTEQLYLNERANLLHAIEEAFGCKLRGEGPFRYQTHIGGSTLTVYFALNPTRDANYEAYRRYAMSQLGHDLPPPACEVGMYAFSKAKCVLFCGLCGGLRGRVGDVHIPRRFCSLSFASSYLDASDIRNARPTDGVEIDNILAGIFPIAASRAITSNLTLAPEFLKGGVAALRDFATYLRSFGDVIDKESYQIAVLARRRPTGILLMTSDIVADPTLMLRNGKPLRFDLRRFCDHVIMALRGVADFP